MNKTNRERRRKLRATASAIAGLIEDSNTEAIRLWEAPDVSTQETGGYSAEIGTLAHTSISLEIWLDRFSGARSDRFYAGFTSGRRKPVQGLLSHAPPHWSSRRTISIDEISGSGRVRLLQPLKGNEYNSPLTEHHLGGRTYFGFYDPSNAADRTSCEYFERIAVGFFIEVTNALPAARMSLKQSQWIDPETYEGQDRYSVRLHVGHDRDQKAARECKKRDGFMCRVCDLRFEDKYGKLGRAFAEAHHCKPFGGLRKNVMTKVRDLVTVCANCHRMLHRMEGKQGDVDKLRDLVASHRGAKK